MVKKKYIAPMVTFYPIYREGPMICASYAVDTIDVDNDSQNDIRGDSNFRYKLLDDDKWG